MNVGRQAAAGTAPDTRQQREGMMSNTMDMSDPAVQDMLEQDKQEALARIREQAEDFIVHACVDAGLDNE